MTESKFAKVINDAMQEKEIGIRHLSRLTGIDHSHLSRILKSERNPPPNDDIKKIASILDLDYDMLLIFADRIPPDLKKVLSKEKAPLLLKLIAGFSDRQWQDLIAYGAVLKKKKPKRGKLTRFTEDDNVFDK